MPAVELPRRSSAPTLTLHHGDAQASFAEHPTEVARQALIAAARVEDGRLADQMIRFAATFPERRPARVDAETGTSA